MKKETLFVYYSMFGLLAYLLATYYMTCDFHIFKTLGSASF